MGTPLQWLAFNVFVLITIVLDLRVFHRKAHKISVREAAIARLRLDWRFRALRAGGPLLLR
jgi:hypothetical protein